MNFKWFTSPPVLKRKTARGGLKGSGNKFTSRRSTHFGFFLLPCTDLVRVERSSLGPRALASARTAARPALVSEEPDRPAQRRWPHG